MSHKRKDLHVFADLLKNNITFLLKGEYSLPGADIPSKQVSVPDGFFGICVATSDDEEYDSFVIEKLRELKVKHVRVDYGGVRYQERFIHKLIKEKFCVCLHLVQPFSESVNMPSKDSLEKWRTFVLETMNLFGDGLEMIEVGSACNRRKWSGLDLSSVLEAWRIAFDEIKSRGLTVAGPNVSDFEPIYNTGLLGIFARESRLPDIHTDNLFVERVTEPEVHDHRIMGRVIGRKIKYNLIKKAALLKKISGYYGINDTICTHTAWSLRRIDRVLGDIEEKHADYLSRYLILAAASGALSRVYWGPMIGQREGLIDDGTSEYPEIPHVTYYGQTYGTPSTCRIRPAFDAYMNIVNILSSTEFMRTLVTGRGLEIHEFRTSDDSYIHAAWTTNGNFAITRECYMDSHIEQSRILLRDGSPAGTVPPSLNESPVFLCWPPGHMPETKEGASIVKTTRIFHDAGYRLTAVNEEPWRGLFSSPPEHEAHYMDFLPARLEEAADKEILRDRRNCVWSLNHPDGPLKRVIVKRLQVKKWYKRLIQRFRLSKALKSWNGSQELLRRGIHTPRPVCYFERTIRPSVNDSYFVYEHFDSTASARTAFTELQGIVDVFQGIRVTDLHRQVAAFVCNMHDRGVYFRDLSAGNLLMKIDDKGHIDFSLIDTGRARFFTQSIPFNLRISDLKRLLHPMDWPSRKAFLAEYLKISGYEYNLRTTIPLALYDLKHIIKKWMKDSGLRKK